MTSAQRSMTQNIQYSTDEMNARIQLAAAYRIFAYLGWSELIYSHITLRIPGPEKCFLINPYGLTYDEVNASNLVKVDLEGNIIGESEWPINAAGFVTHSAIHSNIPDAHCVMHAHTTAGMAVACSQEGLSMSNIYAAQLHNRVAYHDFEGITVYPDEGPRLLRNIGNKQAIILRNHGLFSWGNTVQQAFNIMWLLNRACEIQVVSKSMGPVIEIPELIRIKCSQDSFHFNAGFAAGQDAFDALTRVIGRIDPTYQN